MGQSYAYPLDSIDSILPVGIFVLLLMQLLRPGGLHAVRVLLTACWPTLRPVLGWFLIVLGILGIILPVLQGIVFLVLGIALVGPRHPLIRGTELFFKRLIWRWSARRGLRGLIGRRARAILREFERQYRKVKQRIKVWRGEEGPVDDPQL
jgi:hypothetical protein